jgi:hypothetical protein
MLVLGGASGSCNESPAVEPEKPAAEASSPEPEPEPQPAPTSAPAPSGKPSQLTFDPWLPVAGQPLKITSSPITFNNGCQGIASVEAKVEPGKIIVTWTPKPVPPDAICTMALHADFATTTVEGLEAGTYRVEFLPSGGMATIAVRAVGEPEPETHTRQ